MWLLSVLKLFGGFDLVGIIGKATDVYKAKLQAGSDNDKLAADLAARQLQVDMQDAQLQAQLASGERGWVRQAFAYPPAIYLGKIWIWDKVLGLGTTDPIDDRLFWVMQTIIIAYFGSRTVRDVVTAFRQK